jgi:metallophosphoesterase (TIGR03767 family)
MESLSRRDVLRLATAGVPASVIARALQRVPGAVPSAKAAGRPNGVSAARELAATYPYNTLVQTMSLKAGTGYQPVVTGTGEPFLLRTLSGKAPQAAPATAARRSILYFGQVSDTHMVDAQTPARADFMFGLIKNNGAFRPQEAMTTFVLGQMVEAVNAMTTSPVTGAPMAIAVVTGDYADSQAENEMNWHVDILDGRTVVPSSGKPGVYEGVQAWWDAPYAYHPDDPAHDMWGKYGYPALPGLLTAAVSTSVESEGLDVPWYAVLGNHDSTFLGTLLAASTDPTLQKLAVGDLKIALCDKVELEAVETLTHPDNPGDLARFAALYKQFPEQPNVHTVTADPHRVKLSTTEVIDIHFTAAGGSGPVGHGFTEASRLTGAAWWKRKKGPAVTFIGMDSNNHVYGTDGCIVPAQFQWIKDQLIAGSKSYYDNDGTVVHNPHGADTLFVLLSHHPSWSMDNTVTDAAHPEVPLTGADLEALILRFPNVILWVNGHTHANTIVPHPGTKGQGPGFWEVNSPSCIDWGQQGRLIDLVDNLDGTLSIFTITLDHASPATPVKGNYSPVNLSSISRQLSANVWWDDPNQRLGQPQDRNTELVIKAPFDLSVLSDQALQRHQLVSAAVAAKSRLGRALR